MKFKAPQYTEHQYDKIAPYDNHSLSLAQVYNFKDSERQLEIWFDDIPEFNNYVRKIHKIVHASLYSLISFVINEKMKLNIKKFDVHKKIYDMMLYECNLQYYEFDEICKIIGKLWLLEETTYG